MCVDAVDRFLETFNRGVPPLDELAAPGYSYAEPWNPGPFDAKGHVELMTQALQRFPDRRCDVRRRVPGADGVVVEATWTGTPAGGGEPVVLDCRFVFDIEPTSGKIARARGYYDMPSS